MRRKRVAGYYVRLCEVPDANTPDGFCSGVHLARGRCQVHWSRARFYGMLDEPPENDPAWWLARKTDDPREDRSEDAVGNPHPEGEEPVSQRRRRGVYLTDNEWARWKRAAKAAGLSVSAWVRRELGRPG